MPDERSNIVIEPLGPNHDRGAFSCGVNFIDHFLRKKCLEAHSRYKVRAYIARQADSDLVLGYYTLSLTALKPGDTSPEEAQEKFGAWAIPFVYLGLLGVTEDSAGQGIGSALMLDAFKRTAVISYVAGTYGLMLDAINEEKARWYADREFLDFGRDGEGRVQMHVPITTIHQSLAEGGVTVSRNDIDEMFRGLLAA